MTANMTQSVNDQSKLILELSIDAFGLVTRKESELNRKDTLEGTLLLQIYPGIKVARVSVPTELDAYEQSLVESRMANLSYQGIQYKLAGASGAAKDGRFYFVDTAHAKAIAERFQHWPEAAMVYFSILISDCKTVIEEPNMTVLVVKDHILGTNGLPWLAPRVPIPEASASPGSICPVSTGVRCTRTEAGEGCCKGNERSRG